MGFPQPGEQTAQALRWQGAGKEVGNHPPLHTTPPLT